MMLFVFIILFFHSKKVKKFCQFNNSTYFCIAQSVGMDGWAIFIVEGRLQNVFFWVSNLANLNIFQKMRNVASTWDYYMPCTLAFSLWRKDNGCMFIICLGRGQTGVAYPWKMGNARA